MIAREIADSDDDDDLSDDGAPETNATTLALGSIDESDTFSRTIAPGEDVNFSQFLSQSQSYNGLASSQANADGEQQLQPWSQALSPTQPFSSSTSFTQNNINSTSIGSIEKVRRDVETVPKRLSKDDPSAAFSTASENCAFPLSTSTEHSVIKSKRERSVDSILGNQSSNGDDYSSKRKTYADNLGTISTMNPSVDANGHEPTNDTSINHLEDDECPNSYAESKNIRKRSLNGNLADVSLGIQSRLNNQSAYSAINHTRVLEMQSSVGGHQTLTITDPNHNPFAEDSSALSTVEDQTARIARIFRPFHGSSNTEPLKSLQTTSSSDGYREPLIQNTEHAHDFERPTSQDTLRYASNDLDITRSASVSETAYEQDLPTRQSRKRKRQKSVVSAMGRDISSIGSQKKKGIDAADRSDTSHTSDMTTSENKRGRRSKAKATQDEDDDYSKQDDLLPEGGYDGAETIAKASDSSPTKHPSSEVNLSDEAFIGLPKENYVPRPSRYGRRASTKLECETSTTNVDSSNQTCLSQKRAHETDDLPTQEEAMLPPPPKQSPRKSKKKGRGKRTKTSALISETQSVVGDDDREVIYVDGKQMNGEAKAAQESSLKVENDGDQELEYGKEDGVEFENRRNELPIEGNDSNAVSGSTVQTQTAIHKHDAKIEEDKESEEKTEVNEKMSSRPKKRGQKSKAIRPLQVPPEQQTLEDTAKECEAEGTMNDDEYEDEQITSMRKRGRHPLKEKSANASAKIPQLKKPELNMSEDDSSMNVSELDLSSEEAAPSPNPSPERTIATDPGDTDSSKGRNEEGSSVAPKTDNSVGPKQHSPLKLAGGNALYRVGLSKRAKIPSLLRKVGKDSNPTRS